MAPKIKGTPEIDSIICDDTKKAQRVVQSHLLDGEGVETLDFTPSEGEGDLARGIFASKSGISFISS